MADQFTYKKLPSDSCLTQEKMIAYIDGKLSAADQHACEKHMADCPMCEDALEGLALVKDRSVLTSPLKEVSSRESGKVVPLQKPAPKLRLFYATAAVLVVIFASVYFLKNMTSPDAAEQLADNAKADSTSVQFNEPVATEKMDCLRNNSTTATATVPAAQGESKPAGGVMKAPVPEEPAQSFGNLQDWIVAEEEVQNEASEEIVFDDNAKPVYRDADAEDLSKDKLGEAPADEITQTSEVKEKEESGKKEGFFERTKAAMPQTGVARSEQQQKLSQDISGTDTRNDAPPANVPASPQAVGGVSGSGDVADTETANVSDSVSVAGNDNSAEQSYQSGLNLLNSGQANAAIAMFDKVLQDKNNPRYEDAEFQKANALIKANRKAEAKVLLQSIEAKKGKHAAEATELLKTL